MATVDASIPLQLQQIKLADPTTQMANAYSLKNMADDQQAKQQALQQQKLLQQAFQSGDISTPEGQQALVKQVAAFNPQKALEIGKQFGEQALQSSNINKNNAEVSTASLKQHADRQGMIANASAAVLNQYKTLKQNGVPEAQARAQVQPLYQQTLSALGGAKDPDGKPLFSPNDLSGVPADFDPTHVEAIANSSTDAAKQANQLLDEQKAAETKRNNLVENQVNQQKANAESSNANTNVGRLKFEQGKFMIEDQEKQKDPVKTGELRKEFNALVPVKTYNEAVPNYQALKESYKHDDPQSGLDMIAAYSKLFNPGGVIRESEVDAVMNASSFSDRVKGQIKQSLNSIIHPGSRAPSNLSADARRELLENGTRRQQALEDQYQSALSQYGDIAKKTGVDPTLVLPKNQGRQAIPTSLPDTALPKVGSVVTLPDGSKHKYLGGDPTDNRNFEGA